MVPRIKVLVAKLDSLLLSPITPRGGAHFPKLFSDLHMLAYLHSCMYACPGALDT